MNEPQTVGALGEDAIIQLFARPAEAPDGLVVGNGDDAAAWRFEPPFTSVITTDSLVEGYHFDLAYSSAFAVGRKLVAVNVSDLAAMGARPRFALLSVCLPSPTEVGVVRRLADGVHDACAEHGVVVFGGNTTGIRGPIVLTATLIGQAEAKVLVCRAGAQPGDAVFVTGVLGDAAAGLHLALRGLRPGRSEPEARLLQALVDPEPRVAAGQALGGSGLVHAMCDVSDGLGRDLPRILESGLGARIEAGALPMSDALVRYAAATETSAAHFALAGGEDYELLFTAHPDDQDRLVDLGRRSGTSVTRIGTITESGVVEVVSAKGDVSSVPTGFEHFTSEVE